MNRKNAKRNALLTSIISLLLCVSMLVGTTFAWFTDEVKTGMNTIAAGNLDIELLANGNEVDSDDKLFSKDVNGNAIQWWEPGMVVYENLQIVNKGTLALKYRMSLNFGSENDLNGHKLSEVLKVALVDKIQQGAARTEVLEAAKASAKVGALSDFYLSGSLAAGEEGTEQAIVIFWEPSSAEIDNLYNANNNQTTSDGQPLHIEFGVNLFATQLASETDSFGPDYDKGAAWTGEVGTVPAEVDGVITITSGAELAALAADVNSGNSYKGKTIKLGANIDLNDIPWTPIGNSTNKFDGTFIGTGYTISNLFITGKSGVGLFGYTWTSAHIEGVTIDGAIVSGNDYVGAILGSGYLSANCVKDCTVKNADITAMPFLMADGKTYDGGAKAGAVVGYARNGNITGNTAINCTVTAYRDLGGIAGMVSGEDRAVAITGNTANTVTLSYVDLNGAAYESGKVNENMGDVAGRLNNVSNSATLDTDNTATNVTRNAVVTWNDNGVVYIKDVDAGIVKLSAVTEAYTAATLEIPEGVTALGSKILNGNTTLKEVIIPASVTNFGGTANAAGTGASGGMFYQSAVEKITLSEGLTEIPAAAFNQAANLKEVNIPSTVTTIGINAFAGTGLEELYVPATVTSIGYGAFRDMAKLTTVTIEGDDVYIPEYAFRACAKLTTVVLNVKTLTLGNNMIFTNTSTNNENPNKITIIAANDDVYNALNANAHVKCTVVKAGIADTADELIEALEAGEDVFLTEDVKIDPAGMSNAYGTTGINVKNGQTIDGNGNVLDIKGAGGTWDSGINTTGGVIKNITVTGSFRGIFINHNSDYSEKVVLKNVTIQGTTYTISCDQGMNQGLEATNSTFKGWTSYAATLGEAKFVDCYFGYGNGYSYCRPYAPTEFVGCDFEAGYQMDARAAVTFENCTIGGEPLTAENLSTLVTSNIANATVK